MGNSTIRSAEIKMALEKVKFSGDQYEKFLSKKLSNAGFILLAIILAIRVIFRTQYKP